jgi:hypothetical protein
MGRGLPEDKFSENIDRLLTGQEIRDAAETDQDLKSALDFARLMKLKRPQPAAQFQSNLKARLLEKLAEQEAEVQPTWFQRLMPRQPVWQAVTAVIVILVISGIVLGIVLHNGGTEPVVQAPTTSAPAMTTSAPATTKTATTTTATKTTTATTTAAATTTSAAPSATVPSGIQGVRLSAEATTDKSSYAPGEPVVIQVNLKNLGARPVILAQFPPILSLMSAAGEPVLSFMAGQSGRTLVVGESVSFYQVWGQKDARGRSVASGRYYLELEDIDMQGQAYKLKLSQPVSFEITN